MRKAFFFLLALGTAASACSSKSNDNAPAAAPPTLTMTVTPTTIAQNGMFHVKIATTNFTIKDIGADAEKAIENGTAKADPTVGHYHIYLDSTDQTPIDEDGADVEKDETMPCALDNPVNPGAHKLIARLHYSTHKIVLPEVTSTVPVTVTAGKCMGTGGAGGAGAGGATAGTGGTAGAGGTK